MVGYLSKPTDQTEAVSTSAANMFYANTVMVTARRDASHSGRSPASSANSGTGTARTSKSPVQRR